MQRGRWCAGLLVIAVLASGCGSGDSAPGLTLGQRQALLAQLEAARSKASIQDLSGTEDWLRKFRASVARLERSGALTADAARLLRLGATRVLARAKSDSAPVPTPTVTTPAPPPPKKTPPGKAKGFKEHKGKGHKGEGDD